MGEVLNIDLISLSEFISCVYLSVIFILLMDIRTSKKVTFLLMSAFVILSFIGFSSLEHRGYDSGVASAIALTLPSMALFFILSKHRDGRFLFTFCSVDIMGLIIIILSRATAIMFDDNLYLIFALTNLGLLFLLLLAIKFRIQYIQIQNQIHRGWWSLTFLSVLFYLMLYFIISYPTPLKERREYVPVAILFSLIVVIVYVIVFQTIMKSLKIYNSKQEKELLEIKLELQSSQLELKEVYYKMAYTDALTGLKNRAALEDMKAKYELDHKKGHELTCLSMDLNNLKETNDILGHSAGDALIKKFAEVLNQLFNDTKDIFRVGGDEFVVLYPDIPENQLDDKLEAFYLAIEKATLPSDLVISVAVGRAKMSECKKNTIDELLKISDERMYQNKFETKALREA